MAKQKKPKNKKAPAKRLKKAVPPPDDPRLRHEEFDADREFDSEEMARKRLEAIKQTRKMPVADDEDGTTKDH